MKALRLSLVAALFSALSLWPTGSAVQAASFTLFGDAMLVSPGHNSATAAQLRSNTAASGGLTFGGVSFATPAGMTVSQLTNLATDYEFTEASCGGGAPRFAINIGSQNIFVYLGPFPNYTGCPPNSWTSSGNLVTAGSFVDTSQLPGGTFYDPWASALAKYGADVITGIQLVTDSSWFFGTRQTVLVDNVMINDTTFTFESSQGGGGGGGGGGQASQCKNGGWRNFTSSPGPFKNQGQCVSHFARQHGRGGGDEQGDDDDQGDD
jgi:hypothetical protein